jgi:valyl-tRNA synthetase
LTHGTCIQPRNQHYVTLLFELVQVLETGHDILFFWVARMIMMGIGLTGQVRLGWLNHPHPVRGKAPGFLLLTC